MITCFPDPYPDELLFSVCARFSNMMSFPNKRTAVKELFGSKSASAAVDLPNGIGYLISNLPSPHRYTVDSLIDKNTLFPFYAPFIPSDRAQTILSEMYASKKNRVRIRLGSNVVRIQPSNLKFCPECVLNDRRYFGETYWHRLHQTPGVEVCPLHLVFLELSTAPWRISWGGFEPAEKAVNETPVRPINPSDRAHAILLRLARSAAWLLERRCQAPDDDSLRNRYYNLMLRQGLAYYNGNIRSTEFLKKFIEFYTIDLLKKLQCSIGNQNECWLLRLLHSSESGIIQNPLRHLLLMLFLDCTPDEIFTKFEEYKPFGDGPWQCLNKASDHYLQPRITHCRVIDGAKKHLGKPLGTFTCDCGFTYFRTGPDQAAEETLKIYTVLYYGHVWEKSLRELWDDPSLSISEIARRLGVIDLTVKRHAIKLGLTFPRKAKGSILVRAKVPDRYKMTRHNLPEQLESRRQEWLNLVKENPEAGRRDLKCLSYYLWLWLRRNDFEWLEEHSPAPLKVPPKYARVDWRFWDTKLAPEVEAVALRIKGAAGQPIRVSKAAIIRAVGYRGWFERKINKLPRTAEIVKKYVEPRERFMLRKVKWAEEQCRSEGIFPTRYQFIMLAGALNTTGKTRKVQDAIDAALKSLLDQK
jgi:Tn7-like transposition protein D/TniQ